jgi:hypothetical protein
MGIFDPYGVSVGPGEGLTGAIFEFHPPENNPILSHERISNVA